MPTTVADQERKKRILTALSNRTLSQVLADDALLADLKEEAESPDPVAPSDPQKIVTRDLFNIADAHRRAPNEIGLAFFSSADVVIVPGFMGSELADEKPRGKGLIWLAAELVRNTEELLGLKLGDNDADPPEFSVRPRGAVPLIYGGLKYALEFSGYDVRIFGFDWRKHVDASAAPLANLLRERAGRRPRPLHLIAHSQGSLVARRALQMLGPDIARRVVNSLVLLGPATAGSFSAAFALANSHELLDTARRWGLKAPDGFGAVLQSMTGIYQLLPWRTKSVTGTGNDDGALRWVREHFPKNKPEPTKPPIAWFRDHTTWESGIDSRRLEDYYGWGETIDAGFMNDRTTIILGDVRDKDGNGTTVGGVKFDGKKLIPDDTYTTTGDGTVPDSLARIEGVTRVFKAAGAEHMMLPATWAVIMAVRDVLADQHPRIETVDDTLDRIGLAAAKPETAKARELKSREVIAALPVVKAPVSPDEFFGAGARRTTPSAPNAGVETPAKTPVGVVGTEPPVITLIADVSPPAVRRLKVFSFDPLFAGELENLGAEQVTIELPWTFADGDQLRPGPVGEYVEVVDFDSSSRCFYPPVDLNHPHVLAQDGIPVSEGDPRFHQQMVYAVMMNTIRQFEVALGRAALWAPNLPRDQYGEVEFPKDHREGDEYVGRLRVYPHAMRELNAYYSSPKKALLLGYCPANGPDVGRNLPGGMIFSSLSYDIIAHETTHALLDGMHRHFTQPSNPDVLAFHEAFADLVALLQHFSHPEVLRHQISKARGDLGRETTLGILAAQFGEASGQRAALREYLGRVKKDPQTREPELDELGRPKWEPVLPDVSLIQTTTKQHARGAILVAAVFRAFLNIYEYRVKDLRRLATRGTGKLPDGDISPDLVNRMANEAAKAATHVLQMCVRALDYVPPVDITFGEYLRALITADYDLVRNDDKAYRLAVISAFRDWGIYPEGVRSLSVDSLLWVPPDWRSGPSAEATKSGTGRQNMLAGLKEFFKDHPFGGWGVTADRREAYMRMNRQGFAFHEWLNLENLPIELATELGLRLDPKTAPRGIRRKDGKPVFSVHTFRPCRRIGPDGQELTDVVVEVLQRRLAYYDEKLQRDIDNPKEKALTPEQFRAARPNFYFRGGCTLIIDPNAGVVRYCIRKSIGDEGRLARERACRQGGGLLGSYLTPPDTLNPFAALHAGCDHEH